MTHYVKQGTFNTFGAAIDAVTLGVPAQITLADPPAQIIPADMALTMQRDSLPAEFEGIPTIWLVNSTMEMYAFIAELNGEYHAYLSPNFARE